MIQKNAFDDVCFIFISVAIFLSISDRMDAARKAAKRARTRVHNQTYRAGVRAKISKVNEKLSVAGLNPSQIITLVDGRNELKRKLNHRGTSPGPSTSSAKRQKKDNSSSSSTASSSAHDSDSDSESGVGSAASRVVQVSCGEEGSDNGDRQEPNRQEDDHQESDGQEPDDQEHNDISDDFQVDKLAPFSLLPSEPEIHPDDRDCLVRLKTTPRRELNAMLLALKVKQHNSEKNSISQRIFVNSLMFEEDDSFPTDAHKHKEYLRRMCPIRRDIVLFCYKCGHVSERRRIQPERQNTEELREDFMCHNCSIIISDRCVKTHHCKFIICSIRDQIASYLKETYLSTLLRRSAAVSHSTTNGEMHKHLKYPDFLDLSIGCDAAPITKKSKVNIFPCMFFFNNIPPNYQLRFSLLGGLFSGPHNQIPDVSPFFQEIKKELKDLAENPIIWSEPDGEEYSTRVFVTISQNDSKQKSMMLRLNDTSGRYSCPYCYERGVNVGGSNYRMLNLVHRASAAGWRSEEDYLSAAQEAAAVVAEGGEVNVEETYGVKGFPVLYHMPHFDAIWSTAPDTLHVVYEGVVKKILTDMCTGKENPNGILQRNEDFTGMSIQHMFLTVLYFLLGCPQELYISCCQVLMNW